MPFVIRTTLCFAGLEQGWTESFYWTAPTDDLDAAETLVTPVVQKRAALLAKDYTLTIFRNTIVVGLLGVTQKRLSDIAEPRTRGVQTWSSAQPNEALMCVWQTANNKYQKKQYLRGVPAGITDNGKVANFGLTGWSSAFNAWREGMALFGAGWLRQEVTALAPITSFTCDPVTARVAFILNGGFNPWPLGLNTRQRVYVAVPGRSPLDGPLIVYPTDATHCFTPNPHPTSIPTTGQFGTMSVKGPVLTTLAALTSGGPRGIIHPQRMVTHKTGRPSYASRGRVAGKVVW